jgi:hypothetical protein
MEVKQAPITVLEIGVGGYPFPPNPTMLESWDGRELDRKFVDGSMYIGIDYFPDPNRYWIHPFVEEDSQEPLNDEQRQILIKNLRGVSTYFIQQRTGESIHFLVADAHQLPFPDQSISEVFMSNVIGSQLGYGSVSKILINIERVLSQDGHLVIRETMTPQWSFEDDLEDNLKQHGFQITEMAKFGTDRYNEYLNTYGATREDIDPDWSRESMYYCTASRI